MPSLVGKYRARFGREWRSAMWSDAQTIALVGCSRPMCNMAQPGAGVYVCGHCSTQIIAILAALAAQKRAGR